MSRSTVSPGVIVSPSVAALAALASVLISSTPSHADFVDMALKNKCVAMSFVDNTTGFLLRPTLTGMKLHKLAAGEWDAGITATIGTLSSLEVGDMHFVDASTGYVVGGDTVFKTTDGGKTWNGTKITVTGGQNRFSIRKVDFGTKTHGVLSGLAGVTVATKPFIATTTDGGKTWNEASLATSMKGITAIAMAGAGMIVAGGLKGPANAAIWMSTDGGKTWTERNVVAKGVIEAQFLDDKVGFVVSYPPAGVAAPNNEQVLRTLDGGKTWTSPSKGVIAGVQITAAAWVDKDNGYVAGAGSPSTGLAVARTKDGGKTWNVEKTPTYTNTATTLTNCIDYPGPGAYAGSTNGRVNLIKNETAGGARPQRYTGTTPTADAGAADTGTTDAGVTTDATTTDSAAASDAAATDAASSADAGTTKKDDGGGCAVGGASPGASLLMLLALLALRRRASAQRATRSK